MKAILPQKKQMLSATLLMLLAVVPPVWADHSPLSLTKLKSAYTYNIAKFTRWPAQNWPTEQSPFTLCLYGKGQVIEELQHLSGKFIGQHPITTSTPNSEVAFNDCNALFISTKDRRKYRYLLSLIDPDRVLTISDNEAFLSQGGLIHLFEREKKLRFAVNLTELNHSQLELSSKLLKLAIKHNGVTQ